MPALCLRPLKLPWFEVRDTAGWRRIEDIPADWLALLAAVYVESMA